MTAADAVVAPATRRDYPTPTRAKQFGALLRSEWTKLWSVRSTLWSLFVTIAIIVGLGALFCAARVARADRLDLREVRHFDPTGFSLNGIFLAQLAVGVLGVLVMSSEYATGQIRATFGATPQRNAVLAAKVAVFMAVVFVVGLVACFAAFFIGQSILSGSTRLHHDSISDATALRAVIGGALYLSVLGTFGIGLGTIFRRTVGAIAALVGVLLILPILVNFLPSPWNTDISKYLPLSAGNSVFHTVKVAGTDLSVWPGFAVFCAYAVVSLVVGAVLLARRDA